MNMGTFFEEDLSQEELGQSMELWATHNTPGESTMGIRKGLGRMLFTDEDWEKKLSILSGGELTRLKFAVLMMNKPNVLILDEPTNHLDLESRIALSHALRKYEGTVLFVSHDQDFVSALASRVLFLDKESHEAVDFSVEEA